MLALKSCAHSVLQMMACMFITYKLLGRLFGSIGPVGRLPFEPPPFLQKVTHRGLTGADPRDCSAVRCALPAGSSHAVVLSSL